MNDRRTDEEIDRELDDLIPQYLQARALVFELDRRIQQLCFDRNYGPCRCGGDEQAE